MTVSVILPNYNYGHFLPIALEAILSQSLSPLEVLVLDDASTDGSVEIIKSYQKKFPLIKLITDAENKGVVSRINQGIDLAQGTYLAFCAADDEVMPGFFEKSIELLEKHPLAALCASRYCFFYHDAPFQLHCFPTLLSQEPAFLAPSQFLKNIQTKDCRLGGQNALFRRKAVIEAKKLIPQLGSMSDWFLILTLAFKEGLCFIPEPLTKLRIHPQAYSQRCRQDTSFCSTLFSHLETLLKTPCFQDVRPSFIRSGILYQLGLGIFPALLSQKKWDWITIPLLRHLTISALKSVKHHLRLT